MAGVVGGWMDDGEYGRLRFWTVLSRHRHLAKSRVDIFVGSLGTLTRNSFFFFSFEIQPFLILASLMYNNVHFRCTHSEVIATVNLVTMGSGGLSSVIGGAAGTSQIKLNTG